MSGKLRGKFRRKWKPNMVWTILTKIIIGITVSYNPAYFIVLKNVLNALVFLYNHPWLPLSSDRQCYVAQHMQLQCHMPFVESLWGNSGTGTLTWWAQMPSLYELLCVHGQYCSCAVPQSASPDRESRDKAGMHIPCLPAKLLRIDLNKKKKIWRFFKAVVFAIC